RGRVFHPLRDGDVGLGPSRGPHHAGRGTCCGNGCRHCPYVA
ncbi:MAG: DUF5522 domain-containing protein, partial [bacterium]